MRPPCHTQHGGQSLCSCPSWGCRSLSPNRRAGRFLVMRWRHRGAQSGDTDTPWRTPFTSVRLRLGKALLGELVARAKTAGLREMIAVIADQGAEASLALHARYGFVEVGRMGRVGFKFDRWLGTIMLQKTLK